MIKDLLSSRSNNAGRLQAAATGRRYRKRRATDMEKKEENSNTMRESRIFHSISDYNQYCKTVGLKEIKDAIKKK